MTKWTDPWKALMDKAEPPRTQLTGQEHLRRAENYLGQAAQAKEPDQQTALGTLAQAHLSAARLIAELQMQDGTVGILQEWRPLMNRTKP